MIGTRDMFLRSRMALTAILLIGFLLPSCALAQPAGGDSTKAVREDERASQGSATFDAPLDAAPPAPPGMHKMELRANGAGSGSVQSFGAARMGSPTLGATIGGAQDIGYARKLIAEGMIPKFIDFSPEGLYSEHDIPTPSSQCNEKLCLSLGYGYAPTADNSSYALFVHLGMSSNIRPEEFRRTPLALALVVDRSGSMWKENMGAVKTALRSLVARLTPDDEICLISFNEDAELLLPPMRVSDKAAILAAIDSLKADGGTSIEAGLTMGFAQLTALPTRPGVSKRLMLFTDALPNVGRTDSASFRALTERYASQGIGLTAFGVGVDFGQELVYHISQLRGGNFFYLETPEKIAKVFDKEFDYLVTPLVYDLDVTIKTPSGLKLTAVYGLPTWKPGSRDAELRIPTVFLSSNRGAIVLRYERDGSEPLVLSRGDEIADGRLAFNDVDGSRHSQQTLLKHDSTARLEPGTQFYTHDGMRMAVALTNIYFGLRDGCTLLTAGKREDALKAISRARGIAALENLTLFDKGLANEVKLLEKLEENIDKGGRVRREVAEPSR